MVLQKENNHAIDNLLAKYLLHETTEQEFDEAEKWIHASPENKGYFDHFKQVWQSSQKLKPSDSPDEEEAWKRFQQRIKNKQETTPRPSYWITRPRLLAAAAILLLIIAGGWLFRQMRTSSAMIILASGESVQTDTLTDGTIITLNKHSKISYPIEFSGKSRTIKLQGEAYFDVAQENNRPFIVQVDKVKVTVLGTTFNISETEHATEVIVETGRVQVSNGKQSVRLKANEKVIISPKEELLKKQPVQEKLYNYYRTQTFTCNNTPLSELTAALNEAYNAHIVIADTSLRHLPITTTFHRRQPLDTILFIISQTFSRVNFYHQGSQIILHKKNNTLVEHEK